MNSTLSNIKKKIVDPEIRKIKGSVLGFIAAVYYTERRCDIVYFDTDGALRKIKRLPMPTDGDGVFNQSLKPGDEVELTFRNKSASNLFISRVYRRTDDSSDFSTYKGQLMPNQTQLF